MTKEERRALVAGQTAALELAQATIAGALRSQGPRGAAIADRVANIAIAASRKTLQDLDSTLVEACWPGDELLPEEGAEDHIEAAECFTNALLISLQMVAEYCTGGALSIVMSAAEAGVPSHRVQIPAADPGRLH